MTGCRVQAGVALVAGLVLVAGCSSSSGTGTEPVAGTTASATGSPGADGTASVEQWASTITPIAEDHETAAVDWDAAGCSPSVLAAVPDCSARLAAMVLTAETAAVTIEGLRDESGPQYLGEPPDEIASLVEQTGVAARAAANAGSGVRCPGEDCTVTADKFSRAWDALGDAYAGWGAERD
ncbi:hypothetical protein [Cellulomonas sp. S1-8]|uniref:hypothetical protein n=1 Tax=Cellulomonas sp. S1-8 TaxID=2904790 RepID=UPI002242CDEF|nr:hypothetical protein [Cellulomonas sp. S1-8]UZN03925.1 hypothetical protein OKX07_03000 [Cellulomonas sp. S1-8]